jgi:hypothetical protein
MEATTSSSTGGASADEIEALRRELLRSRRDNAQFQLKVKNLSHALEGVQEQRHEADLSAIRSHIVENRAVGPLIYEGVRVSVSTESQAAMRGNDATSSASHEDLEGKVATRSNDQTSGADTTSPTIPPPARATSRAVRVTQSHATSQQPSQAHFVMNSFAALDVSSRLATAQAGRRTGASSVNRAAPGRHGSVPIAHSAASSWAEIYGGPSLSEGNEGLPTPPRASPPGAPHPRVGDGAAAVALGSRHPPSRVRSHDWGAEEGDRLAPAAGSAHTHPGLHAARDPAAVAAALADALLGDPPPIIPLNTSIGEVETGPGSLGTDEDEEDEEAPPPPPLGSPSAPESPVAAFLIPPAPEPRERFPPLRRHSLAASPSGSRGSSPADVTR